MLVCYTAVFSVVTQSSSPLTGALRDDTKNVVLLVLVLFFFPYYSCSFLISLFILFRLSVFLCPYAVQCFALERRVKGINYS